MSTVPNTKHAARATQVERQEEKKVQIGANPQSLILQSLDPGISCHNATVLCWKVCISPRKSVPPANGQPLAE